jgi:SAM-dependent methyltransferase
MTDQNAQFTGSIPAAYDALLGPMLFAPYAADLAARLRVPRAAAVLEVACGTGILTNQLRRALPAPATLTATDLNEPMLAHARARVPDAGITWQPADAQDLPFPDSAFDAVVCQFGMMFVPDKARAFGEVRRVLRPQGQFAFNVWSDLAENPVGRIARETIARYFTGDPPTFYEVPFSLHDASYFEVVSCERVELEARSATAQDAARGLVMGNPILRDVVERASAGPEEIVQAVAAALSAAGGAAPLRLPMRALVCIARAV